MVERVEVKDVRVPEQLQRAMAAEAEAARNARAKVIAAEGEHKASRSLRQAAEVIMDSPAALQVIMTPTRHTQSHLDIGQLRYLQTLNGIAAEHNSTIIFPVPIDILSNFMQLQPSQQGKHFLIIQNCVFRNIKNESDKISIVFEFDFNILTFPGV